LSTCPPTDAPICASSPTAWIAVVTSCGPEGGPDERGGGGGGGVTGRCRGGVDAAFGAFVVRGFAALVFAWADFAAVAFAASVFGALDFAVAVARAFVFDALEFAVVAGFRTLGGSRRPNRSGRVAGRLPRTLGCALAVFLDFFGFPVLSATTTLVEGAPNPQYSHRKQRAHRSLNPENIAPRLTPRSCTHESSGQGAPADGRPSQLQRCLAERRRERDIDVSS
jgi:hypothetical protein